MDIIQQRLAHFLIPHAGNNHHPHSIRSHFLLLYLALILSIQVGYNLTTSGQVKVLSFATNIQQTAIINSTNVQRLANGVGSVQENSLLDQVAALKAADMFANNYWAHVSPTGVSPWYWYDQVGYKYIYAGENLARDFDTTDGVIQGWMNSPTHRQNLLDSNYTQIGVAVVNGSLLGHDTTLVVQEFGRPQFAAAAAAPVRATPAPASAPVPTSVAIGTPATQVVQATPAAKPSTPVIKNPIVAQPASEADISFTPTVLSLSQLNTGQILMLLTLIPILAFFLFDALILFKHKKMVVRGHSFVHATLLGMLVIIILTTSFGVMR